MTTTDQILKDLISTNASPDTLLKAIIQNDSNTPYSALAELLLQKQINAHVTLAELDKDDYGIYNASTNTEPSLIQINRTSTNTTQIFLHEYMHGVTYEAVRSGDDAANLYLKRLAEIKHNARSELKKHGIDPDEFYGLNQNSHIEELVAEVFTDDKLRDVLKIISTKQPRGTKYQNTIKSMYDEIVHVVNKIIGGKDKDIPVVKEIIEIGAGLMIVDNKYRHAPQEAKHMNMITNDRGDTVAAVGNEISIARAKVRWPNLIEATQNLYNKHPHHVEDMLINQIAAQDIRNSNEAQAVLDAAILPLTDKRINIDPEKYTAMFAPTKFNIGDPVTFINDYGVIFENKNISGIEVRYGEETRYSFIPTSSPWMTSKESNFTKLTLDQIILDKLERLFPEDKQDQDGQVTIDLIPPNGKDFYERLTIRTINPDDSDILPPNSFHIKHYTASPAIGNMLSDSEQVKREFTFSIEDNKVKPYWLQNEGFYYDLLPPQKTNARENISATQMKHEINIHLSDLLKRVETKDANLSQSVADKAEPLPGVGITNLTNQEIAAAHKEGILTDGEAAKMTAEATLTTGRNLQSFEHAMTLKDHITYVEFTTRIQSTHPTADNEKLNTLCQVAHDMSQQAQKHNDGQLSTEKFNQYAATHERTVKEIIKDLPGTRAELDFERGKLQLHTKDATITIPAIPVITMKQAQEATTPVQQQTKGHKR